jgi:hypothetical protein
MHFFEGKKVFQGPVKKDLLIKDKFQMDPDTMKPSLLLVIQRRANGFPQSPP